MKCKNGTTYQRKCNICIGMIKLVNIIGFLCDNSFQNSAENFRQVPFSDIYVLCSYWLVLMSYHLLSILNTTLYTWTLQCQVMGSLLPTIMFVWVCYWAIRRRKWAPSCLCKVNWAYSDSTIKAFHEKNLYQLNKQNKHWR